MRDFWSWWQDSQWAPRAVTTEQPTATWSQLPRGCKCVTELSSWSGPCFCTGWAENKLGKAALFKKRWQHLLKLGELCRVRAQPRHLCASHSCALCQVQISRSGLLELGLSCSFTDCHCVLGKQKPLHTRSTNLVSSSNTSKAEEEKGKDRN